MPLQHYLWCREKMFKIFDNGMFLTQGSKEARTPPISAAKEAKMLGAKDARQAGGRGGPQQQQQVHAE